MLKIKMMADENRNLLTVNITISTDMLKELESLNQNINLSFNSPVLTNYISPKHWTDGFSKFLELRKDAYIHLSRTLDAEKANLEGTNVVIEPDRLSIESLVIASTSSQSKAIDGNTCVIIVKDLYLLIESHISTLSQIDITLIFNINTFFNEIMLQPIVGGTLLPECHVALLAKPYFLTLEYVDCLGLMQLNVSQFSSLKKCLDFASELEEQIKSKNGGFLIKSINGRTEIFNLKNIKKILSITIKSPVNQAQ
ncbi:hypothetical protein [Lactobacillus taiwanensis]|uniref:hypothetical protein n=1 Tax=Lactobacillus taiwanensis TaxID=508451 RepID=UPI00262C2359|nr:hypothetical protein [Lactobacillus taiwanensis]